MDLPDGRRRRDSTSITSFAHNKSWRENFDSDGVSHPGQTVEIPPDYDRKDMHLPKGAICLMHGNLIHGSYPNLSETRSRPQYSMAYLNKGEPFDSGKTSKKEVMEVE